MSLYEPCMGYSRSPRVQWDQPTLGSRVGGDWRGNKRERNRWRVDTGALAKKKKKRACSGRRKKVPWVNGGVCDFAIGQKLGVEAMRFFSTPTGWVQDSPRESGVWRWRRRPAPGPCGRGPARTARRQILPGVPAGRGAGAASANHRNPFMGPVQTGPAQGRRGWGPGCLQEQGRSMRLVFHCVGDCALWSGIQIVRCCRWL